MNIKHLSDSYDFVKRVLLSAAPNGEPFTAVPMFTNPQPNEDQLRMYRNFLGVDVPRDLVAASGGPRTMWRGAVRSQLSYNRNMFLDPDIGIRVNGPTDTRAFVLIEELAYFLGISASTFIICYDQSLSRGSEYEDRVIKMKALQDKGFASLYFASHSCFLATAGNPGSLQLWKQKLVKLGVALDRFHGLEDDSMMPELPE